MDKKQTSKETPTPTLLEVLDKWGRQNEKRMKGKHLTRRNQRNKYN